LLFVASRAANLSGKFVG